MRAIILDTGRLLTIKRQRNGQTYWVFPGGGVEAKETHTQALEREVLEETGLKCRVQEFITKNIYHSSTGPQLVSFYHARVTGGQIGTGTGPEYTEPNPLAGTYTAEWLVVSELKKYDLRPKEVRDMIIAEK
ncbi:MAG: NUDIX domain-containing protein [Candidatus Andersenbacteria bacterium]